MTATADQFVAKALSQDGDRYIFGVEVAPSASNPSAFDCSELVQWCLSQIGYAKPPDGARYQAAWCSRAGLLWKDGGDKAATIKGALLFEGDPVSSIHHVAISQGDGRTIEARGARWGVGQFTVAGRPWTYSGLIPGLDYSSQEEPMRLKKGQRSDSVEDLQYGLAQLEGSDLTAEPRAADILSPFGMEPGLYDTATATLIGKHLDAAGPVDEIGPKELARLHRRLRLSGHIQSAAVDLADYITGDDLTAALKTKLSRGDQVKLA